MGRLRGHLLEFGLGFALGLTGCWALCKGLERLTENWTRREWDAVTLSRGLYDVERAGLRAALDIAAYRRWLEEQ